VLVCVLRAKPKEKAQPGWSGYTPSFARPDHPVRSGKESSRYFLDVAATPPRGGGDFRFLHLLILSLITLLPACSHKQEKPEETEHVVTVDVAPVLASPISLKVTADALLYPLQQAAIVPKISAPVKKFYVERGARVRAGQLLAELENRDLAGAIAENQAAYDQAEANYQTVSLATVPEETQKAELDVRGAKDVMDQQQKIFDGRQAL